MQVAHYHCVSRVVDRNFVLGELEKESFVKLMRRYETYCGVRIWERAQGTDTPVKPFPRRIRSKGCMRRTRFKAEASVQVAHYHCVSRVVDRNFVLGELEKEIFVKLMRRYETYCGGGRGQTLFVRKLNDTSFEPSRSFTGNQSQNRT